MTEMTPELNPERQLDYQAVKVATIKLIYRGDEKAIEGEQQTKVLMATLIALQANLIDH